ncbi:MAG: glycoside hydrolase family 36 protein [Candidatus Hodarchaeales archaeon]
MIELIENKESITIQGKKINVMISKSEKSISIISLTTNYFIDGISPAINLKIEDEIVTLIPDTSIECPLTEGKLSDEIGTGKYFLLDLTFVRKSGDSYPMINAQLEMKLYNDQDFCIFQLKIPASFSRTLDHDLHSLAPLMIKSGTLILNEKGNTRPEDVTFFEQGFQSWSFSKTRTFEEAYESLPVDVLASIHQNQDNAISGWYASEFVTAITDRESKGSIILGFCTLANSYSRIVMDHLSAPSQVSWLSALSQFDSIPINRLQKHPVCSEELFICFKSNNNGYQGLVNYAEVTGKKMNVQVQQQPRTGWCSWYYYYLDISNAELLKNVKYFERSPNISLDMLQLDDGYFTAIGDYTSFNDKFPSGISEFVDLVHEQGKAAGIWIAPFFAAVDSHLFQEHPEWFLRSKKDQELLPVCYNWNQVEYALDLTRADVQEHVRNLIQTIVNEWHCDFIKIDFVYAASVFESLYHDKGLTRAQIYRKGIKLIREAMGDQNYLLGCGAPLSASIGLVDAMRVSMDTKEIWETGNELEYGEPCLKGALITSIYRSFMYQKFWINDPDCLIVRKINSKLTEDELKLQLTVFGLTGGQLLLSDDMEKLEEDRFELALKLVPPYPKTALPVDALYESLPTLYLLETEQEIGKRALLAVINWNDELIERGLVLKNILSDLAICEQYLVFDWWQESLLGCFTLDEKLPSLEVPPHGCRYLGIVPCENQRLPLFLSSTIHISQGLLEIKGLEIEKDKLIIMLEIPGRHSGELFIFLPEEYEVKPRNLPITLQSTKWGTICKLHVELKDYQEVIIEFEEIKSSLNYP